MLTEGRAVSLNSFAIPSVPTFIFT
jgi:hypothetical protein